MNDLGVVKWKKIGIIGGFGPRASAFFYKKLIDICSDYYGSVLDSDFPNIFLVSLSNGSISPTGMIKENNLTKEIIDTINLFERMDIGLIAVPCNSIFTSILSFPKKYRDKIINLPDILAKETSQTGARKAIILCSRGLKLARTYDQFFLKYGIEISYPEEDIQLMIDKWILQVMGNKQTKQSKVEILILIKKLELDYDNVILACTELSVLLGNSSFSRQVIECSLVLGQNILQQAQIIY
jgi:aspartate racemase